MINGEEDYRVDHYFSRFRRGECKMNEKKKRGLQIVSGTVLTVAVLCFMPQICKKLTDYIYKKMK